MPRSGMISSVRVLLANARRREQASALPMVLAALPLLPLVEEAEPLQA